MNKYLIYIFGMKSPDIKARQDTLLDFTVFYLYLLAADIFSGELKYVRFCKNTDKIMVKALTCRSLTLNLSIGFNLDATHGFQLLYLQYLYLHDYLCPNIHFCE